MGSIYKTRNRWRVQFRRIGHDTIDECFGSYEEAKTFHDKVKETLIKHENEKKYKKFMKSLQN